MPDKVKVSVLSDLHLEFGGVEELNSAITHKADLYLLAGDIDGGVKASHWASYLGEATNKPVVFIMGNHEYYHNYFSNLNNFLRHLYNDYFGNTHCLQRDKYVFAINGQRICILGCTLWTDFALYGPFQAIAAQMRAIRVMADLNPQIIKGFSLDIWMHEHEKAVSWLKCEMNKKRDYDKLIVLTHHAPSIRSIHEDYGSQLLNAAYASNLDELFDLRNKPDLWVHGHMHTSFDYVLNETRVVCNPRGYYPHALNPDFNPKLVIEL